MLSKHGIRGKFMMENGVLKPFRESESQSRCRSLNLLREGETCGLMRAGALMRDDENPDLGGREPQIRECEDARLG